MTCRPTLSCYGETAIETPELDRLASEGLRFTRAYATSPVCSSFRSRDPLLLTDWAAYLDSVRITDSHVGQVLQRLKTERLLDNTLVICFTEHGISHTRGKQFLYDEGTHIPLILRGPGIAPETVRQDLVEHIDVAAVSPAAAGIPIPNVMQGRDVLATDYSPRQAVYAARDRCGETMDHIRSVRTERFADPQPGKRSGVRRRVDRIPSSAGSLDR